MGPLFNVEGFLLQPPAEYKLVIPDSGLPEGVSSYIWAGAERKDGTRPTLMVSLLIPPAAKPQSLTLNQIASGLLEEFKARYRDWTQTPAETGMVPGMKFVRIGWSGVSKQAKLKAQGWTMVTRDGDTFIELSSQDAVWMVGNRWILPKPQHGPSGIWIRASSLKRSGKAMRRSMP